MGDVGLTEFFAAKIPAGKAVIVGKTPEADDDVLDTIHLSQVALGPEAAAGRHVVWVEYGGKKAVIGSLNLGKAEQFQIDFPVNREIRISHSGKSEVYITGYTTHHFLTYGSSEEEDEESDEMDSDEDVPAAVPLANGPASLQRKRGSKQEMRLDDDYDSDEDSDYEQAGDDEDEDDSEEDSEEEGAAALGLGLGDLEAHEFSGMEDSDEEETSSEDEGAAAALMRGRPVTLGNQRPQVIGGSDEEESDEEDDEDEEDEDDGDESEEDSEDEEAPAAVTPKSGAKRQAAATAAGSAQKKAKAGTPAAAATPTGKGGTGEATYEADLTKFLKAQGPTKLAVLGSQVKRAPGLPKMKRFLEVRAAKFAVDEQSGIVSLRG